MFSGISQEKIFFQTEWKNLLVAFLNCHYVGKIASFLIRVLRNYFQKGKIYVLFFIYVLVFILSDVSLCILGQTPLHLLIWPSVFIIKVYILTIFLVDFVFPLTQWVFYSSSNGEKF